MAWKRSQIRGISGEESPAAPACRPLHSLSSPGVLCITRNSCKRLPLSSSHAASSRKPSQTPPSTGGLVPVLAPLALCAAPSPGGLAGQGAGSSCDEQFSLATVWPPLGTCPALDVRPVTCAHGVCHRVHAVVYATCPRVVDSAPAQSCSGGGLAPLCPLTGSPASVPTGIAAFRFGCREGLAAPVYKCLPLPQLSGGVWRPR